MNETEALYAADAALKEAVLAAVLRHRAAGVLTWSLLHRIEAEVFAEVAAAGRHSARMLGMLRASPAMGYLRDDSPVSFEGHDVVPTVFSAIDGAWRRDT